MRRAERSNSVVRADGTPTPEPPTYACTWSGSPETLTHVGNVSVEVLPDATLLAPDCPGQVQGRRARCFRRGVVPLPPRDPPRTEERRSPPLPRHSRTAEPAAALDSVLLAAWVAIAGTVALAGAAGPWIGRLDLSDLRRLTAGEVALNASAIIVIGRTGGLIWALVQAHLLATPGEGRATPACDPAAGRPVVRAGGAACRRRRAPAVHRRCRAAESGAPAGSHAHRGHLPARPRRRLRQRPSARRARLCCRPGRFVLRLNPIDE